jgi:hypothetical protein
MSAEPGYKNAGCTCQWVNGKWRLDPKCPDSMRRKAAQAGIKGSGGSKTGGGLKIGGTWVRNDGQGGRKPGREPRGRR